MKPVRGVIFLILGGCCPVGISFPGIFLLLKKSLTSRKICPRYPLEELLLYKLHSSPPLVERHQGLPFLSIFFFYRESFTVIWGWRNKFHGAAVGHLVSHCLAQLSTKLSSLVEKLTSTLVWLWYPLFIGGYGSLRAEPCSLPHFLEVCRYIHT